MGRGKSLLFLCVAFIVAAFVQPVWDWYVSWRLDQIAADPEGFWNWVSGSLAVFEPYQYFLVGTAFGIFVALTVGYWERIVAKLERISIWIPSVIRLAVRNIWTRQLLEGGAWLYKGEATKKINGGVITKWGGARIEYWPKDEVHCALDMSGTVWITRKDRTAQTDIKVQYQIFGRLDFWRTIKKMRERDEIGLVIRLKRRERAQKAKAVSKT